MRLEWQSLSDTFPVAGGCHCNRLDLYMIIFPKLISVIWVTQDRNAYVWHGHALRTHSSDPLPIKMGDCNHFQKWSGAMKNHFLFWRDTQIGVCIRCHSPYLLRRKYSRANTPEPIYRVDICPREKLPYKQYCLQSHLPCWLLDISTL